MSLFFVAVVVAVVSDVLGDKKMDTVMKKTESERTREREGDRDRDRDRNSLSERYIYINRFSTDNKESWTEAIAN